MMELECVCFYSGWDAMTRMAAPWKEEHQQ